MKFRGLAIAVALVAFSVGWTQAQTPTQNPTQNPSQTQPQQQPQSQPPAQDPDAGQPKVTAEGRDLRCRKWPRSPLAVALGKDLNRVAAGLPAP